MSLPGNDPCHAANIAAFKKSTAANKSNALSTQSIHFFINSFIIVSTAIFLSDILCRADLLLSGGTFRPHQAEARSLSVCRMQVIPDHVPDLRCCALPPRLCRCCFHSTRGVTA